MGSKFSRDGNTESLKSLADHRTLCDRLVKETDELNEGLEEFEENLREIEKLEAIVEMKKKRWNEVKEAAVAREAAELKRHAAESIVRDAAWEAADEAAEAEGEASDKDSFQTIVIEDGWRGITSGVDPVPASSGAYYLRDKDGRQIAVVSPVEPFPPKSPSTLLLTQTADSQVDGTTTEGIVCVPLDADILKRESLLLLVVPRSFSFSFGMDFQTSVVGATFKVIPPGPHFVCFASKNSKVFFHGWFFVYALKGKVVVREWDLERKTFVKLSDSEKEKELVSAVPGVAFQEYKALAPYDVHHFKQWQELSNYITPAVIKRFEPAGEAELIGEHPLIAAECTLIEQGRENEGEKKASRYGYTDFSQPELDIMDLSAVILKLYNSNKNLFIGELQFSYVAYMFGGSCESHMQWTSIVYFILRWEDPHALVPTGFYSEFVDVLYYQLYHQLSRASDFVDDTRLFRFLKNSLHKWLASSFRHPLRKKMERINALLESQARF